TFMFQQAGSIRLLLIVNASAVYHTLISTCKLMKVSVTEMQSIRRKPILIVFISQYFSKVFAKIVRGCTDNASLLPMNMGLSVNNH
ncbi:MAG: hypothetical protein NC453_21255, partial [Muribaculum sp.]|nr:hypothetical protein [Muribaculum sp.]